MIPVFHPPSAGRAFCRRNPIRDIYVDRAIIRLLKELERGAEGGEEGPGGGTEGPAGSFCRLEEGPEVDSSVVVSVPVAFHPFRRARRP